MGENPFDQLGIKKALIEQLVKSGQLGDYLKDYRRITLTRIHPDKGGDNGLSAIVNSAIDEIQKCAPHEIEKLVGAMQNGNSEYLSMIEALASELEKSRKIEREYETLRAKHAEVLASGSVAMDSKVKTATARESPSTRTATSSSTPRTSPPSSRIRTPASGGAETASPRTTAKPIDKIIEKYFVIPSGTYALGVHEIMRRAEAEPSLGHPRIMVGRAVYRPLTFEENMGARVEAYEKAGSEGERLKLFDTWLDSCTGIAYKAKSTKFKIVSICNELIAIDESFKSPFLSGSYRGFTGIALDSSDRKYNTGLSKSEILAHPAWLACVNDNKPLLKTYTDIVFAEYAKRYGKAEKLMSFYVRQNTEEDELRAVYLDSLGSGSDALGDVDLLNHGRFLLGSPSVAKKI